MKVNKYVHEENILKNSREVYGEASIPKL